MKIKVWNSLEEAKIGLKKLWSSGKTIGTVHTLGSLHIAHGKLIEQAAQENDICIVTIYPNKTQLSLGVSYDYDPEEDMKVAESFGATHIILSTDSEMYPENYVTFLQQGDCYANFTGSVTPQQMQGMITMSVRWILITRPTKTYWGLKDIHQAILVKKAIDDFNIVSEVVHVPCVRFDNGVPVSSRIMKLPSDQISDLATLYTSLKDVRKMICSGETKISVITRHMRGFLESNLNSSLSICDISITDAITFRDLKELSFPIIIKTSLTNGTKNFFDSLYFKNMEELINGNQDIWIRNKN